MSVQRSCCCGVDQEFGLECIHGDKLTPYPYYRTIDRDDTGKGRSKFVKNSIPVETMATRGNSSVNAQLPLGADLYGINTYNLAGYGDYKEKRGLRFPDAAY